MGREALSQFTKTNESEASPPAITLGDSQIALLIDFFTILDRWDREAHGQPTM